MDCSRNRPLNAAGRRRTPLPLALVLALVALAVALPGTALARGGDDGGGGGGGRGGGDDRPEVRVSGSCGRGATSKLKIKARDGGIEAEFEVDHNRRNTRWSVVFVQEHRVVYRGRGRTRGSSGSFSIEERLADLPGSDQIMARAVGPRGLTCQASAILPG
jgi:hypothetical protein